MIQGDEAAEKIAGNCVAVTRNALRFRLVGEKRDDGAGIDERQLSHNSSNASRGSGCLAAALSSTPCCSRSRAAVCSGVSA